MNLKQLSLKLGLSQTTVSRALNGYPEVNEATRLRIAHAAAKYEYRPSTRAKGLATGKALAIGHVIPISTKQELINPIFGDFIAGAGESYAGNGYEMILSIVADGQEEQMYRGLKARRAVDGVVVHGPQVCDSRIRLLRDIGLPFVVHGRSSQTRLPYSWVDVNNRRMFEQACDVLLDLGHKRIGLINGSELMDFAHRRREGYVMALRARGITPDPALMRSSEMTELFGYQSTREMLALDHPPTALLCASLISAIGARRAIEEAGLVMGRDLSIITHDDDMSYFKNSGEVPIFTATRSSVRAAGKKVADLLLAAIADPKLPDQHIVLEAELVLGRSTGPAPRKD